MHTFKVVSSNLSNYSMDLVWENAQDMEHVGTLHANTNIDFKIMNLAKHDNSPFLYDQLSYIAVRKFFGFIPVQNFGYRKIVSKYKILQAEFSPLLNMQTRLISTIKPHEDEDKCWMVDYVEVHVPWYGYLLKGLIEKGIKRHTKIQCLEDEGFRERRKILLALFNTPEMDIWEKCQERVKKSP